jgi:serine/threonine-protein kinase HipA
MVLLTQNGFVAILKKLTMTLVFTIEPTRVAHKKATHESRNGNRAGSQQQVNVIIEHGPSKAIDTRLWNQNRQPVYKVFTIVIGSEYIPQFDSPNDYMVQRPWRIYSCFSWHGCRLSHGIEYVKHKNIDVPSFMAETKYEAEGGPCLADCFTLLAQFSTSPALDKKALLNWVVFNYLIHNADAHAKNLALLLRPAEIRLAPFYDLLSTGVYEGINPRLAMKIGGENRPQWIRTRHWERMAKEVGIGSALVLRTVKAMAKQIVHAAEEVVSQQPAMWRPAPIVGQIQNIILKHTNHAQTS